MIAPQRSARLRLASALAVHHLRRSRERRAARERELLDRIAAAPKGLAAELLATGADAADAVRCDVKLPRKLW